MVVFTCQHCGDPVKKPAVEKHYKTKCRFKSPNLTCVDCLKDFGCEDFGSHNQCMTEAQRYSAQGTVIKEQRGKKKQEQYIEMIQQILNSKELTLSVVQRKLLEVCSNHDNVPRRPKPFENFVKNVARGIHYKQNDVQIVFNIIENACKKENSAKETKSHGEKTFNLLDVPQSNGEKHNKSDEEIASNKMKSDKSKKSKKKEFSFNSLILEDEHDTEKICNDSKEFTIDQNNSKARKIKKEIKNENCLRMDEDVDEGNEVSLNKNFKEVNESTGNNESKKSKKEKRNRKSLCLDSEDVANPELEGSITYINESKETTVDDLKENVNKISKKQLKKKKKYEKYLMELENEAKFEVKESLMNAEGEESNDLKKERKKNKKLKEKENEPESLRLAVDKHTLNTKHITVEADSRKSKKRKLEECVDETPEKKKKENAEEAFSWADVIMRVLNSRPDKELSLKKLGKKVIIEYQTVKQDHRTYDDILAKFNKKVMKVKGVRVLRDKAKLIE